MFYSQFVLTKKGPLAKIWLAAHMQSKLTKAMVFATDLRKAVEKILTPDAPMALRLSSNLLLGVVRIFQRKTKYLLQESSEAMTNLKLTFRPGSAVDLPENETTNFASITLEAAGVDDLQAPNIDLGLLPRRSAPRDDGAYLAAERDITIDEFAGGLAGGMLDAFALEPDVERANLDFDMDPDAQEPLLFTPSQRTPLAARTPSVKDPMSVEITRAEATPVVQSPVPPVLATPGEVMTPQATPVPPGEAKPTLDAPVETPAVETPAVETPATETPAADAPTGEEFSLGRISTGGDELMLAEEEPAGEAQPEQPAQTAEQTETSEPVIAGAEPVPGSPIGSPEAERVGEGAAARDDVIMEEPTAEISTLPTPTAEAEVAGSLDFPGPDVPESQIAQEPAVDTEAQDLGTQDAQITDTQLEVQEETVDSTRGKKRRGVIIDEETELTAAEFRACLEDTSDLLRRPRTRRRIATRASGPTRYEDLLARPAITLAPQLESLFAQSFQMEELLKSVGSPMSDADLEAMAEKKDGLDKEAEKEVEKDVEKQVEKEDDEAKESPSKAAEADVPPEEAEKTTEAAKALSEASGDKTAKLATPAESGERVEAAMAELEVTPAVESERHMSIDPSLAESSVPVIEEEDRLGVVSRQFDLSKCSLSDVANTRSQVDSGAGEDAEVTEATVSARTQKMQEFIMDHLAEDGVLDYSDALRTEPNMTRRTAARTFYELLNLGSKKALQLHQEEAFGRIRARPLQPTFDSLAAKAAV